MVAVRHLEYSKLAVYGYVTCIAMLFCFPAQNFTAELWSKAMVAVPHVEF